MTDTVSAGQGMSAVPTTLKTLGSVLHGRAGTVDLSDACMLSYQQDFQKDHEWGVLVCWHHQKHT